MSATGGAPPGGAGQAEPGTRHGCTGRLIVPEFAAMTGNPHPSSIDARTGRTVELLQTMIRNQCVNDGTEASGHEDRNVDTLAALLDSVSAPYETYEVAPGRVSLVSRLKGSDPAAPSLCLMGHTDVVPVDESGWDRDPFGGELANGEVWGRGAVDMLNITSSMAVAFTEVMASGRRPKWMADHHRDAMYADYVLTENGGLHAGTSETPVIRMNVGEKGVAWRRIRVHGQPGHGSMPFRADNALIRAAGVVDRLANYQPPPKFTELWSSIIETLDVDDETRMLLRDPNAVDDYLAAFPHAGTASFLHACCHTTLSPNLVDGGEMKTNVIPGSVELHVDMRTLPGETTEDVDRHLREALGEDLYETVEVEPIITNDSSMSRHDTPLWDSLQRSVARHFPAAQLAPAMTVGFTDARVYREMGAVAYGAGLFSPDLDPGDFARRFHGHNERIDVESLRLTTELWLDVIDDMLG